MKRALTISLVLMMLLASTPALAARGGKPKPHGAFNVALSGVLNTGCTPDGTIIMTGKVPGTLTAGLSHDVVVGMNVAIPWARDYDAGWGTSGESILDCHGIGPEVPEGSYGGSLILEVDATGAITRVILQFDYYWQFGVNPKNGRPVQEVLETFSLKSELDDGTGNFTVTLFTKEGRNIVNDWVEVGTTSGSLSATITPTG